DALESAAWWSGLPAAGALAVQALAWVQPIENARLWSLAVLLAALVAWLVWAALRRLSLETVAHRVDAEAGLKERLATALELVLHPERARLLASDGPPLSLQQQAD